MAEGPTALTFVRGDAALAAKALDTFSRRADVLEVKGGLLEGRVLAAGRDPPARAAARAATC